MRKMVPWGLCCIAAVTAVIVLLFKMMLLYHDLEEIRVQFSERLSEDTNNVIYVSGNDRHLKAFAEQINRELGILYDKRRRYRNGDRELKEAVTNISHDLRTPLTAIYGYLELLETELGPEKGSVCTDSVRHYLAQIRNRADAMRDLTEELFRYSVILSGQEKKDGEGNAEAVALNRILADSLLDYYEVFKRNQIEPEIRIPDKEVVRFVEPGALRRVFGNILDNAVKYSSPQEDAKPCAPSGLVPGKRPGNRKMRIELTADGTITFSNRAENLDKVSVERLFDRFYTVETGRNSTGLGLSIAKLLTERMGGRIFAEYREKELTIRLEFK